MRLLKALKHIVEGLENAVKTFANTRMDIEILNQFEIFPRIELQPDGNVSDINRFAETMVRNVIDGRLLLDSNVDRELKAEICNVLCDRSKGMFQLAALQITFLCEMRTQKDVKRSLKAVPDSLADAYSEIYKRILTQKGALRS